MEIISFELEDSKYYVEVENKVIKDNKITFYGDTLISNLKKNLFIPKTYTSIPLTTKITTLNDSLTKIMSKLIWK